jgi:hypothetical protein
VLIFDGRELQSKSKLFVQEGSVLFNIRHNLLSIGFSMLMHTSSGKAEETARKI